VAECVAPERFVVTSPGIGADYRMTYTFAPIEVGCYEPDAPEGYAIPSSNDVTVDPSGLMYLIDRQRGLSIVESRVS